MIKSIALPDDIAKEIQEFADFNQWSFSRALIYLSFVALSWLAKKDMANEPKFTFDVDHPTRQARSSKGVISPP